MRYAIPFNTLNLLKPLIYDLVFDTTKVKEFINYIDISEIEKSIFDCQKKKFDRSLLSTTLREQNTQWHKIDPVITQIEKIHNPNTFFIIVAHQPCILGGPLYLYYKIETAIRISKQLNEKYSQYDFIPLYWMGTEDHDIDEINHIYIQNEKIIWNANQNGVCGRLSLKEIQPFLDLLFNKLPSYLIDEIKPIILACYYDDITLAEATRKLFMHFFASEGLLILDADNKALKKLFIPVMTTELKEQFVYNTITATNKKLESQGYHTQGFARTINLFYITNNNRHRITLHDNIYKIHDTHFQFTLQEILDELRNYPERFSPNVNMRPMYQSAIIPTAIFTGGASEMAYWMQQKATFDYANIHYPIIQLRDSWTIIDTNTQRKIDKTNLNWIALMGNKDSLIKDFITNNDAILWEQYHKELTQVFTKLKLEIIKFDSTLENTVGAELHRAIKSLDHLQHKYSASLKRKNVQMLATIDAIIQKLKPQNELQERIESIWTYYNELKQK